MQPAGYPPAPQPMYAPAPVPMQPAEVQSVKSFLDIARILALILGILILLAGVAYLYFAWAAWALCTSVAGLYCGGLGFVLIGPIYTAIAGVINLLIWMQLPGISRMVDAGQYSEAKGKLLLWMILGFIVGYVIIGIIILLAWLKLDPLINMQRSGAMPTAAPQMAPQAWPAQPQPAYGQPAAPVYPQAAPAYPQAAPAYAQPAPAYPAAAPVYQAPPAYAAPAAPPAAPAMGAAPNCTQCGKPTTFVPQYSRYYCYSCSKYA